jgi:hypothetical protein
LAHLNVVAAGQLLFFPDIICLYDSNRGNAIIWGLLKKPNISRVGMQVLWFMRYAINPAIA